MPDGSTVLRRVIVLLPITHNSTHITAPMNAEYVRTMSLEELLPMVKAELRANKLWREEYEDEDREK